MKNPEWLVALAVVIIASFGIGSCVQWDRQRELACLKAGGARFMVGQNTGCYKVTIEPVQIP